MSTLPAKRYRVKVRVFVPFVDQHLENIVFAVRRWQPMASWRGGTGMGQAFFVRGRDNPWFWSRDIKRGQWAGPWRRERGA